MKKPALQGWPLVLHIIALFKNKSYNNRFGMYSVYRYRHIYACFKAAGKTDEQYFYFLCGKHIRAGIISCGG